MVSSLSGVWWTVALANLEASSTSMATSKALLNVNSSSGILKSDFNTASLETEQINLVFKASSSGFSILVKSHVLAAPLIFAANSWIDSPGSRLTSVKNRKRFRTINLFGLKF